MTGQRPDLEWRAGRVPVSTRYGDPYFSVDDGAAEAAHVFLAGNGLPDRFRQGFRIAELGFGTGLNCLVAWEAWPGPGPLRFTSFEADPLPADAIARALAAFPALAGKAAILVEHWRRGVRAIRTPSLHLDVVTGDARRTLPLWDGRADAWFLDGFAPARNPEMWEESLLAEVARHTATGGTAATYTAAGGVRRALSAAGFDVERRVGYGRKRHMTAARLATAA